MTTLTHRDLGPDKRAAEMSDSDVAVQADGTDLPAARGGSSPSTHGDPVDRRHQHAWVPASTALLTWLIGLSDIVAIFRSDLVHKLHKIDYLVPGTLTTVTRTGSPAVSISAWIASVSRRNPGTASGRSQIPLPSVRPPCETAQ